MKLEEAWAEFLEVAPSHGIYIGLFEAIQLLRGVQGGRSAVQLTPEEEAGSRFLDWLLHDRGQKALAYEYLLRVGTLTIGLRTYWATSQAGRRAIAWESVCTYPDSDSEIWDVLFVDDREAES